jgi:hypothetical protein
MDDRIVAYLASKEAAVITAEVLAARVMQRFEHLPLMVEPLGPSDAACSLGRGFLIAINGTILSVIVVDRPLPSKAYERALKLNRVWRGARNAMSEHSSHVIVATTKPTVTHVDALDGAFKVSLAVTALIKPTRGIGVLWANGDAITEAEYFSEATVAFSNRQTRPEIWVAFDWLDGPLSPEGQRTFAVTTTGMMPFIGRELEWMPAALPPTTIASRLLSLCQYLIVNGPIVRDGETIGLTASERIRARHAAHGQCGSPVVQLTAESIKQVGELQTAKALT